MGTKQAFICIEVTMVKLNKEDYELVAIKDDEHKCRMCDRYIENLCYEEYDSTIVPQLGVCTSGHYFKKIKEEVW